MPAAKRGKLRIINVPYRLDHQYFNGFLPGEEGGQAVEGEESEGSSKGLGWPLNILPGKHLWWEREFNVEMC